MKCLSTRLAAGASVWVALWAAGCGTDSEPTTTTKSDSDPIVEAVTDTAVAAGQQLEIITREDDCVLRVNANSATEKQEMQLSPKAPCHFLRMPGSTSPRSLQFDDVNTEAVLIVSGTPASEESRIIWKLEPGLVCGEESQGVLVRNGAVLVTQAVRKGGITCRDKGVDEKEYWAFAHDES